MGRPDLVGTGGEGMKAYHADRLSGAAAAKAAASDVAAGQRKAADITAEATENKLNRTAAMKRAVVQAKRHIKADTAHATTAARENTQAG